MTKGDGGVFEPKRRLRPDPHSSQPQMKIYKYDFPSKANEIDVPGAYQKTY